jgi:hypothetical protein
MTENELRREIAELRREIAELRREVLALRQPQVVPIPIPQFPQPPWTWPVITCEGTA